MDSYIAWAHSKLLEELSRAKMSNTENVFIAFIFTQQITSFTSKLVDCWVTMPKAVQTHRTECTRNSRRVQPQPAKTFWSVSSHMFRIVVIRRHNETGLTRPCSAGLSPVKPCWAMTSKVATGQSGVSTGTLESHRSEFEFWSYNSAGWPWTIDNPAEPQSPHLNMGLILISYNFYQH